MNQEISPAAAAEASPVKRALLELREMKAKLDAHEQAKSEPIAIVGIGCRFPGGANTPDQFWQLLSGGVDAIREVPADRWDVDAYYDADPAAPGKMSTRWGGFIDDVADFDPAFFGISPREAMAMDPQQRLLLEVGWEALENAGQAPDKLSGTLGGVYVGISSLDYAHLAMGVPDEALDSYLAQGIAHSAASGRVAYVLGLQGPALSVDTACSSSLMAIHLAMQSLRRGECRLALAGGVNAILLPTFLIGFSKSQMMAADGRCKTFDARADGFVRGEGCGVIVLKRLSDALADRDHVWAVIRGSAANQDGRSSGLTAPNGLAQEAVIRAALADAGVLPSQIGYVEAHGTGTSLGDPIEVQALGAVLGEGRGDAPPVLLGSAKTNIGHMEAAAGVAGVIKVALSLRHGEVPPSLHFQTPNPFIPWGELPVEVAAEAKPFPRIDGRRLAGVSSFGFSGTNVHLVLESAPEPASASSAGREIAAHAHGPERPLHLLKLSARAEPALDALAACWSEHLAATAERFTDVCFSANAGRADLPERLAVIAADAAEASARLAAHARGEEAAGVLRGRAAEADRTQVAFLFTGHGAQRVGMGRQLYETQPTFRAAIDECDTLLRPHLPQSLVAVLFAHDGIADSPLLSGMTYSQPALFAIEYALAELWRAWGVEPAMVLGHSVGEYAAAVTAGVFSLADGLKLVAARGRLMDAIPERGAMLALLTDEGTARALVAPFAAHLSVAATNGPSEIVVSGAAAAVYAVAAAAEAAGIEVRRLAVAQAGHSHLLDPILDEFEAVAATVRFHAPQVALVSCTTGRLVGAAEIGDARYWRRHLRETVQFAAAVETLHREGCSIFLEVGPHTALAGMGARCLPAGTGIWLGSMRRDWDEWQQLLETLAALYVAGVSIDWNGFERAYRDAARAPRRRVPLPTYPWQHRRYWLEHAANGVRGPLTKPAESIWNDVLAAGRRQEVQGPLDLQLSSFPARWAALGALTTSMIASSLGQLGAFRSAGESATADELVERLGVQPRYRLLLGRWLRRLAASGFLADAGDRFTALRPLSESGLEAAWAEARSVLGDWGFMLDYLDRCGRLLPAVVTGRGNALETVFPEGSFETADALYRDSILPRYYNAVAGAIVSSFVAARAGAGVRALEVGGGTGGTTATLLPLIDRAGGTYYFTDVSDLFLSRAAEQFGEYGGLSLGLLDAGADPLAQGYVPGSYDLIVAANVVHAVSDIPETLARLRSLLAQGGLLLLVEVTTYLDWFDVSTALLEGWDRQGDALRPDHPMLSAATWEATLREAGFVHAASFPGEGSPAEAMAQHVILAQAPLAAGDFAADPTSATADSQPDDRRGTAAAARAAANALAARLRVAAPHEREDLLVEYVRGHIAALLRLESPVRVERRRRLMELGLDSLMAVELRGRLGKGLDLEDPLPATLVFDYPSVDAIVGLLVRRLGPEEPVSAAPDPRVQVHAIVAPASGAELDALSDAEVEARLLARLSMIEDQTP
jgi:acyl transferase domain-containing protein/SAM-dependent methyltransferase